MVVITKKASIYFDRMKAVPFQERENGEYKDQLEWYVGQFVSLKKICEPAATFVSTLQDDHPNCLLELQTNAVQITGLKIHLREIVRKIDHMETSETLNAQNVLEQRSVLDHVWEELGAP